eukprot:198246-Pelagomonas_calceolata.AAC.1
MACSVLDALLKTNISIVILVPLGRVLPGSLPDLYQPPLHPKVRETHDSLSLCVSSSLIDVISVLIACVFYFLISFNKNGCDNLVMCSTAAGMGRKIGTH